jgi:hypothetical protein
MSDVPETIQYDVKLPKPRPHKVLIGVLVAVLVLAGIGVAAAAIANRTAQEQIEPTVKVMPANTMLYASLNTHTDKLPDFNVIADAWKDSKEAKMVASALELAVTQAGLSWEEDIQPWLGDRVAVGLVDMGGLEEAQADGDFKYRTPFFVVAVQTKDRAKSDAALANVIKEISASSGGPIKTETYRGIPITALALGGSSSQESGALATVNDVIVLTASVDHMKTVIGSALDGQNLSGSANFKTVMSTLPDQTAGALYMDSARFMTAYMDMLTGITSRTATLFCELDVTGTQATPTPECVRLRQQADEQQRKLEEQMQQMRDMLQAFGGVGMAMSYEPTGIRFDTAAQYDASKMPENMRKMYEASQTPASGHVFASIPASAILAANLNMQNAQWDQAFNLEQYTTQLEQMGVTKEEIEAKLAEFQNLSGVDLKADFLDLLNGEAAFIMLPKAEQTQSEFGFSLPFQFAALFDSSDAAKAASSLDKIVQAVSSLAGEDSVKWQSLSGLPYSVVLDPNGKPMLTYGVVDGRLVIGTDSDTLLKIDNADQTALSDDALFKQATGLLPANRLNTFFMNVQPLWDLVEKAYGTQNCQPCNYLKHFAWMSLGSEPPSNGVERGSLHIGIAK